MTAKQFRAARKAAKMTQEKLAQVLEISTQTVHRYEVGTWPVPRVIELAMSTLTIQPYTMSDSITVLESEESTT